MQINRQMLLRAVPDTYIKGADEFVASFNMWATAYGIITKKRVVHYLAQVFHESACLRYTTELASGASYDTGPKAIALGNTPEKDGDGQKYKGRGLIQLTGRSNYVAYSTHCNYDFYSTLDRARNLCKPGNAVRSACWFWQVHGLNTLADKDDAKAVRKRVNGGYNGFDQFVGYLSRAKKELGI
jgi:putative chitinase